MMISTGLPEVSSEKDLNYLRETLVSFDMSLPSTPFITLFFLSQVLDLSEDEALKHFRSKFDEALQNSWKTSLNWASHNFSKNNNK
jgi:phosphatidylinositol-4,5-bisphosphate 3-kinase catalytic subunit alpha/beta/delta